MHIEASGTAIFRVNESGELISIRADELDWDSEGDGERQMGAEVVHRAIHSIGGFFVTWSIWEYPIGVENHKDTEYSKDSLTMLQDIDYGLAHDPEPDFP